MICGVTRSRDRWANRCNLISGAGYFGLSEDEADQIITIMKEKVLASWEATVVGQGGALRDCANIAHAIVSAYPGFEYPRPD